MSRGVLFLGITIALVALIELATAGEDYYQILGVSRSATNDEIKSSYKKLAIKYHPDKHRGKTEKEKEAAQQEFQRVSHAYEVLKDTEKRRIYDQYGEEGLKQGGGGGGFSFTDPFDLFSSFGFGGGGGQKKRGAEQRKGPDVTVELEVTLEDLYLGKVMTVTHKKQVLCHMCRGTGAEDPNDVQVCPVCKGSGIKVTTQRLGPGFVTQTQSTCDKCGGRGKIIKSTCPYCKGKKVSTGEETVTVVVEKGMSDGQLVTFDQEGDQAPETQPGDLIFKLVTLAHKKFTRKGNDLHYKGQISLLESLVGFTKHVKHLDGHTVTLERDGVTKPGFVMTIKGEGMPVHGFPSQKGDLIVEFTVKFPASVTPEQKEGVRKLFAA